MPLDKYRRIRIKRKHALIQKTFCSNNCGGESTFCTRLVFNGNYILNINCVPNLDLYSLEIYSQSTASVCFPKHY